MKTQNKDCNATIDACRYCFMCRHACTSGLVTATESNTPRGRALALFNVREQHTAYDPSLTETIYNCTLCGACKQWCEGKFDMPALVIATREKIASNGQPPAWARTIRQSLLQQQDFSQQDLPEKKADVLFYLGVQPHPRAGEILKHFSKIMSAAGIPFQTFKREPDHGKILQLLGYVDDAKKNASILHAQISKTSCSVVVTPDILACLALKNEFPSWGLALEPKIKVFHVSEYLLQLAQQKKIQLKKETRTVTLADSELASDPQGPAAAARQLLRLTAGDCFRELPKPENLVLATGEAAFGMEVDCRPVANLKETLEKRIAAAARQAGAEKIIMLSPRTAASPSCDGIPRQDILEWFAELI
ncbi:MAG: (Fe-S)-binding protein [Verrucomicrobiae bacterium]|nr:(Fe-S)-binding protein [Verrucomicrobiae bacterium]